MSKKEKKNYFTEREAEIIKKTLDDIGVHTIVDLTQFEQITAKEIDPNDVAIYATAITKHGSTIVQFFVHDLCKFEDFMAIPVAERVIDITEDDEAKVFFGVGHRSFEFRKDMILAWTIGSFKDNMDVICSISGTPEGTVLPYYPLTSLAASITTDKYLDMLRTSPYGDVMTIPYGDGTEKVFDVKFSGEDGGFALLPSYIEKRQLLGRAFPEDTERSEVFLLAKNIDSDAINTIIDLTRDESKNAVRDWAGCYGEFIEQPDGTFNWIPKQTARANKQLKVAILGPIGVGKTTFMRELETSLAGRHIDSSLSNHKVEVLAEPSVAEVPVNNILKKLYLDVAKWCYPLQTAISASQEAQFQTLSVTDHDIAICDMPYSSYIYCKIHEKAGRMTAKEVEAVANISRPEKMDLVVVLGAPEEVIIDRVKKRNEVCQARDDKDQTASDLSIDDYSYLTEHVKYFNKYKKKWIKRFFKGSEIVEIPYLPDSNTAEYREIIDRVMYRVIEKNFEEGTTNA